MALRQGLSDAAIVDTATAVFATGEFDRGVRNTIFDAIGGWLRQLLGMLGAMRAETPALYWTIIGLIAFVAFAILARGAYIFHTRRLERSALSGATPGSDAAGRRLDPWEEAQLAASRGDFTGAAHALYSALLMALARREQLRLHPSKTIGDYVRELRARSSSSLAHFRDFARVYEVVVYSLGTCDRERYERLVSLAVPLMESGSA